MNHLGDNYVDKHRFRSITVVRHKIFEMDQLPELLEKFEAINKAANFYNLHVLSNVVAITLSVPFSVYMV